jgi:choline dehydrogenase
MAMCAGALPEDASFDYVIVGAGSAGCVIANRLSQDPAIRVCLLEAGPPDRHPLIRVPAAVAGLIHHPRLDWRYRSQPQPHAAGRCIAHPAGRVLGGSSSINGMVYSRGHPSDYDGWAAEGNAGWSWAEVLPHFLRSEDNEHFEPSPWHARGGPMRVSSVDPVNPLVAMFLQAGRSLGLPVVEDFNGADDEGVGPRQTTIRAGRRESSATAFLRPAQGRANLVVCPDAFAHRILLQERRATGVEYGCGGAIRRVLARREVIVSAGAYASPALLMRSGIGDAAHLRARGITPVHALPGVGANLQDHIAAPTQFLTDSTLPYGASVRAWPKLVSEVLSYLVRRRGLLASNVFEAAAFVRTEAGLQRPDLQLVFMPVHRDLARRIPRLHGFGIQSVVLHPQSRGQVTLASADPLAAPAIDPGFLTAPADLQTLLRGVRLARRLLGSPAFAPLAAREILPGPQVHSDEALAEHVRAHCATTFHPVGTCRMGPDGQAVVDASLRVHGIEGLRVADASVMPSVPGGNTHAPAVMIGEKASDMILARPPLAAVAVPGMDRNRRHAQHADAALDPFSR